MVHDELEFHYGEERLDVSDGDKLFVANQLGREPRGLQAIQVRRNDGNPAVIRVSSLVERKPFPTLFWLVDPQLCYQLDRLEAAGTIAHLQQLIDVDEVYKDRLTTEHKDYISLRESYMTDTIKQELRARGYWESLSKKGIGGIGDFSRIRCLHTYYAAHLVNPNLIGELLASPA